MHRVSIFFFRFMNNMNKIIDMILRIFILLLSNKSIINMEYRYEVTE